MWPLQCELSWRSPYLLLWETDILFCICQTVKCHRKARKKKIFRSSLQRLDTIMSAECLSCYGTKGSFFFLFFLPSFRLILYIVVWSVNVCSLFTWQCKVFAISLISFSLVCCYGVCSQTRAKKGLILAGDRFVSLKGAQNRPCSQGLTKQPEIVQIIFPWTVWLSGVSIVYAVHNFSSR